jgi:hypothetical protein
VFNIDTREAKQLAQAMEAERELQPDVQTAHSHSSKRTTQNSQKLELYRRFTQTRMQRKPVAFRGLFGLAAKIAAAPTSADAPWTWDFKQRLYRNDMSLLR